MDSAYRRDFLCHINVIKERPNRFIKLDKNPNPETDAESYVSIDYIENQPAKLFTRPIRRWELSKEDEIKIDKLLLTKKK